MKLQAFFFEFPVFNALTFLAFIVQTFFLQNILFVASSLEIN